MNTTCRCGLRRWILRRLLIPYLIRACGSLWWLTEYRLSTYACVPDSIAGNGRASTATSRAATSTS
eukprot:6025537-Pyramimonas_sp.AAC.1